MVLIKFLIWGQFLCLWTKCRVRTELFTGGRISVELALGALGDNPSNQITLSLTSKCLQSGVLCSLQHGQTSSTSNNVTVSVWRYLSDSEVITLFIVSRGVFLLYSILRSRHNSSKLITSMFFIFTKYLLEKFFRSSSVKIENVVTSILTLLPRLSNLLSFILRVSVSIKVFPVPALPNTNRQMNRLLSTGNIIFQNKSLYQYLTYLSQQFLLNLIQLCPWVPCDQS